MISKIYLSATLPTNISKLIKCFGLYKDKFTTINQTSSSFELSKSFSYNWNYLNSYTYLQNLNNPTPASPIIYDIIPNVKKTVIFIEGSIQNNSLSQNISSYCSAHDLNFVKINGTLAFLEDTFLEEDSQKTSNDKLRDSLSKIKNELGEENITIITTNTAFSTSRLYENINTKNQIHISPLVNTHSLQFLHHNCKKLLQMNCKQVLLREIQDSTNEISEERLKKLYELYYTPIKELLGSVQTPFQKSPQQPQNSNSQRYFVFSRADEIQPYDPKALDNSGLTEKDNIFLLNDYSSLMQLTSQQDPIVYLLDQILNKA